MVLRQKSDRLHGVKGDRRAAEWFNDIGNSNQNQESRYDEFGTYYFTQIQQTRWKVLEKSNPNAAYADGGAELAISPFKMINIHIDHMW